MNVNEIDLKVFQKLIQDFHNKFYYGENLSLVIYTSEDPELIEEWVEDSFSKIN